MPTMSYHTRRGQLETYFDRTAADAWKRLTSDAPVGKIRATVRAGRDSMRETLLSWLPDDLSGTRLLDAGCGTGSFAVEAARRGASVVAIDISPTLIDLARERAAEVTGPGRIEFRVGDMLDPALGEFDHVVAMDSLIHYQAADTVQVLERLAARTSKTMVFTFAPRTPMLSVMHAVGKLFPRGDRAPAIQPLGEKSFRWKIVGEAGLADWSLGRTQRVKCGFYISQALELVRACAD
ncbi:magnesium protoporphyrin IX methyltransferase [Rhodospirillum rubrum]|uniref:Magnesium protoporphyrin IX methyltransferase n=1 Tax=Rhodospirillum rubrum (strain ATCC 11170 / ATH 1.1.1 / DSM 467 / LMG 4362 / NCIMB 8255 / S1) TaxID=269796 RepID=Q2RWS2_RHORT|nr:magnesium protoporphyrin IX methyltransferase [Rhodospirillum rubrum]ABC21423.1 Magnesium protoporphyrin O-methyltransferase [Rhodospirillum rubrum ATCC 11170]AEO47105.1 Mg-protoporphyrin IX methyl transferase [Rhodospirillum rubrum F11]MBK5953017.1 magnesium protoporphyrin IX methyltransferase [Rhodospirillum rubrum]QXG81102.1 magnesium protoporphyrin IX methyltransferase [Rhodospirillum rubrum]HAQ00204.1 magnesium protoporphyrin IX methyltransferase [Rhodospirillum rubrum]